MFVVTFHSNYILDKPEAREKPQRPFNSAFLTLSSHASEYFESSQHVAFKFKANHGEEPDIRFRGAPRSSQDRTGFDLHIGP